MFQENKIKFHKNTKWPLIISNIHTLFQSEYRKMLRNPGNSLENSVQISEVSGIDRFNMHAAMHVSHYTITTLMFFPTYAKNIIDYHIRKID